VNISVLFGDVQGKICGLAAGRAENREPKRKRGYSKSCNPLFLLVPRDGIEPPTRGFSVTSKNKREDRKDS
jgi:hypothetical protein